MFLLITYFLDPVFVAVLSDVLWQSLEGADRETASRS